MGRVDLCCPRARAVNARESRAFHRRRQRPRCRAHGTSSDDHHRVTRSRLNRDALLSLLAGSTFLSRRSPALAADGDKIEDIKKLLRYSEKNYGDPETNVDLLEQVRSPSFLRPFYLSTLPTDRLTD